MPAPGRGFPQRRGRLQRRDKVDGASLLLDPVQRMAPSDLRAGRVGGEFVRAANRRGAVALGHPKDFIVLGAHPDTGEAAGAERLLNRPRDQRLAAEVGQVLARNALRFAAGGHYRRDVRR